MAIRIKDNKEPLVEIRKYCPGAVIDIDPIRKRREKTLYLRLSVAKMLGKARQYLPAEMNFIIRDAWRPSYVQAKIYYWFIKEAGRHHPELSREKVIREVKKYVAPWKGIGASGHMTGGAVDLRLVGRHGRKIPMKSGKLNYQENSLSKQKNLPKHILKNREILFSAMKKAGFSNHEKEFWHWSYGDYYWAKSNGKSNAIYGPVADVNHVYENEKCPCGSNKRFERCCGKV